MSLQHQGERWWWPDLKGGIADGQRHGTFQSRRFRKWADRTWNFGGRDGEGEQASETNARFTAYVNIWILISLVEKKTKFVQFIRQLKLSYTEVKKWLPDCGQNKGLFFALLFNHRGQPISVACHLCSGLQGDRAEAAHRARREETCWFQQLWKWHITFYSL